MNVKGQALSISCSFDGMGHMVPDLPRPSQCKDPRGRLNHVEPIPELAGARLTIALFSCMLMRIVGGICPFSLRYTAEPEYFALYRQSHLPIEYYKNIRITTQF